ncbi:type I secretion system permease/ATPase [Bradyrhizobium diazoefficiens]|uniref:type I secretion system permease/ATPase n=1 Tax=Bradyrhizobium diazoefficiens TaxID=1355477 RepID=UPI00190BDB70|nr:type I secretion system permease/ATPase [Bradyrhizobium diazoefficiens]QQO37041.1 type I secretion system permease/ATPase [Bradyrhizobium diazoefficiens]
MDRWGIGNSSDAARTGGNPRTPNVSRFDPGAARHHAGAALDELGEVRTSHRADAAASGPAASQPAETRHLQVHSKDPQASPPLAKGDGSGAAVIARAEKQEVSHQGGSNGGGTRSGGGGGGGGWSPLQKATGGDEYRDTLSKGLASIKRNFLTIGIFSFVVNLLALSIPIYLFNMSDRVLTSRSVDTLIMLTTIVIFAIAAHVLMDMMRRFILMRVAVDTEVRLGGPVLSAAAKAAQSGSSREFQTLADLQQLRSFMTGPVLLTMFDAPIAPVYLIVVFLIHPQLGLIVTAAGLGLTGLALLNQHVTADPFTRASVFVTRANLQAEAMARNAQVINAMGMIPEGVRVWGQETVESLKAQVIAQDRNVLMTGLSKFLRLGTQIAILGWGAILALESHLTGGMIIAASIVSSRALAPLEGTIEGWRSYVHARSAYQRIKTLLQNTPLNLRRLRLPRPEGRLSVERILYVPPPTKKVILNGVSFALDPGESLAIVGPSGTGKTMLARMLVGSIIPTAGNVRLDLMDLRNWDPRQFGECVGYLPQDVQLFPASIKANIARMRDDARDADIFDAAETADVHEMIAEFPQGYETVIGMDGSPLSGGQRQRIGLARAFYGSPRLVVLDEPNANLDTSGELALAKALTRAKQKGTTIVAVTQRPALLQSVDKILILQNGSVQAFGARDEMIHLLSGRKPPNGSGPSPGGPPILSA